MTHPAESYGAKLYPPDGKVLHIAGQTQEDIADYVETVSRKGRACGLPAGTAFWTNTRLDGVYSPAARHAGDHHQDLTFLLAQYDNTVLHACLWLAPFQLRLIRWGLYDRRLRRFADVLRRCARPVYLRLGSEFDGTHNKYNPQDYQRAYRHIVHLLARHGVENVAYVWHSIGLQPTYRQRDVMAWYPGDGYVDWIGISVFLMSPWEACGRPARGRILDIAREKRLPVMICESSPLRPPAQRHLTGAAYWDYWFEPYFAFIEDNPEVKAFTMINADWDSQKQFVRMNWGDCRLASDPVILERWRAKLQEQRYLHSSPDLYAILTR